MQYLKDEQYYIDLYDLFTIKRCMDYEKTALKVKLPPLYGKNLNRKKPHPIKVSLTELSLYFITGDRYKAKASTIREWMERDRKTQDFFDNTSVPTNINCPNCGDTMQNTIKDLANMDKPMRLLFFFECPSCKKRKGVYDNGEVFASKPDPCDKCESPTERSYKKEGSVVTTIWKCNYCKHVKKESDNYEENSKSWKKEREEDRKLLEKYRSKYCLSEKEGQEYIHAITNLNNVYKTFEEESKRQADPAIQKAINLTKLNIADLEKLLIKALVKEKYIKLTLAKPEIERYVIVPFTVQDADSSRAKYDSTNNLQKLIKKILEKTNWRLMSEGTNYRLGYLSGRLKGYEREEDMAQLFRVKKSKDEPIMVDEKGPIC